MTRRSRNMLAHTAYLVGSAALGAWSAEKGWVFFWAFLSGASLVNVLWISEPRRGAR